MQQVLKCRPKYIFFMRKCFFGFLDTGLSYCTKSTLHTGLLVFFPEDCLGFAFCPLAVSYKPGSTVNRHSDKSLFLLTLHKSENEKRKQRGRMLKLSSAKLVCCVQSWNTRLSCFLELWEIASPIVCISWLLFCLKAFHCVCSSNVKKTHNL